VYCIIIVWEHELLRYGLFFLLAARRQLSNITAQHIYEGCWTDLVVLQVYHQFWHTLPFSSILQFICLIWLVHAEDLRTANIATDAAVHLVFKHK
jgi:hypothetical protein